MQKDSDKIQSFKMKYQCTTLRQIRELGDIIICTRRKYESPKKQMHNNFAF